MLNYSFFVLLINISVNSHSRESKTRSFEMEWRDDAPSLSEGGGSPTASASLQYLDDIISLNLQTVNESLYNQWRIELWVDQNLRLLVVVVVSLTTLFSVCS